MSGNGQYQSGAPYTVTSGRDNSLTGLGRDRAKFTGVSFDPPAGSDKTVWFNPAAFAVNDVGTFGTVGTGRLLRPPPVRLRHGVLQEHRITERVNLQFRAEMFNIFNQVNFDNPNTQCFAVAGSAESPAPTRTRRSAHHSVRVEAAVLSKKSTQRRRDAEAQRRREKRLLRLCVSASLRLCVEFLMIRSKGLSQRTGCRIG